MLFVYLSIPFSFCLAVIFFSTSSLVCRRNMWILRWKSQHFTSLHTHTTQNPVECRNLLNLQTSKLHCNWFYGWDSWTALTLDFSFQVFDWIWLVGDGEKRCLFARHSSNILALPFSFFLVSTVYCPSLCFFFFFFTQLSLLLRYLDLIVLVDWSMKPIRNSAQFQVTHSNKCFEKWDYFTENCRQYWAKSVYGTDGNKCHMHVSPRNIDEEIKMSGSKIIDTKWWRERNIIWHERNAHLHVPPSHCPFWELHERPSFIFVLCVLVLHVVCIE